MLLIMSSTSTNKEMIPGCHLTNLSQFLKLKLILLLLSVDVMLPSIGGIGIDVINFKTFHEKCARAASDCGPYCFGWNKELDDQNECENIIMDFKSISEDKFSKCAAFGSIERIAFYDYEITLIGRTNANESDAENFWIGLAFSSERHIMKNGSTAIICDPTKNETRILDLESIIPSDPNQLKNLQVNINNARPDEKAITSFVPTKQDVNETIWKICKFNLKARIPEHTYKNLDVFHNQYWLGIFGSNGSMSNPSVGFDPAGFHFGSSCKREDLFLRMKRSRGENAGSNAVITASCRKLLILSFIIINLV